MNYEADHNGKRFLIEHEADVGFFLFVYEGSRCIAEYFEDTVDASMAQAATEHGVPSAAWRQSSR